MAKTMAINAGSSSLKFQLIEMPQETVIAKGLVERIGLPDSIFKIEYGDDQEFKLVEDIPTHDRAVELLFQYLPELNILSDYHEITGVGHRVVAGGELFKESALVTDEVIQQVADLGEFAPLHNPAEAAVMRAFKERLPECTMAAVFDTSFHTTMPAENYLYSLPYEYYEQYGARKYGAHGTSHRYVARRAADIIGKPFDSLKIITCHLGNGASITAIKDGKSYDTSMGFTPLAGITMGTRTGDIDASLVAFLMSKLNITNVNDMIDILNKKSGMLGLSGVSSDMRDIEAAANSGNERAQLALEIYYNRVKKYIGQYVAAMDGVDAIVFTAGIGENSKETRQAVIDGLSFFGAKIDPERNNTRKEAIVSSDDSKIFVVNVPTNEEVEIAREVERLKK
ncbi:acetate kinase [Aerococcaceae bacterium NML210727]|nr:acetate kinase [Aerococcaceae bacterium NML210727]MCW6655177.1 acetate kinase [Aerococcaceae bacterium NML201296]MCW6663176.1 acetate kinase [Aerococcaceae bacterium NML190073]MCW6665657.1 acetate kinase [Aerococcaceae bacterium NML191219]MCW6667229.1 acetate kinase [Aerococcaceae bacterium NML190938]MCW6674484.1 acetate kinase [Aerococcaceae bacterium NML171108]MCW6681058.1 acetate kinase [Aerococcaceae bacterium NML130460]MCW6682143.1 acetate kinase [Aerococcaceae bacterium NML160702]M